MKLVTWNINSVRLRIEQVIKFLNDQQPDVLCLQELKCPDEHFPHHTPDFKIVDSGLQLGVKAMTEIALDYLDRSK